MTSPNSSLDDLQWALDDIAGRRWWYQQMRKYAAGDQQLAFASEKFLNAFGGLFGASPTNLMPIPIDAVADRLIVSGFDNDDDEASTEDAWDLWTRNRMDKGAGETHQEALTVGDAFLTVWPDQLGVTRFWHQRAEQIAVLYDPDQWNTIIFAARVWCPVRAVKGQWRATLYYPDRVERYVTRPGRHQDGSSPTKATEFIPYTGDMTGPTGTNPYGVVPVIHFANNAPTGTYGTSELRDLIKIQDKFNKTTTDMLVAMEFAAYPQRWAVGFEPEIDDATGRPRQDALKPGVDRFLAFASEDIKLGQFATADLTHFLAVLNAFREEIAIVSGLPLHYLMPIGRYPSGEAIKMAEGRLVAKVRDRQIAFGSIWADGVALALRISTGSAPVGMSVVWRPSETRNDLLEAQVQLVKQQLGVSQTVSLTEMGYSAEDIDEMLAADAQTAKDLAALGQAALLPPIVPASADPTTTVQPTTS